jgi:hypothetical protein
MTKLSAIALFILGLSSAAFAGAVTPEIDGATALSAITLVTGAALIIKSRKK